MPGPQHGKVAIVTGGTANLGRLFARCLTADVVPVVHFLAAPDTRWVTAQTVYVNGGMISPIN